MTNYAVGIDSGSGKGDAKILGDIVKNLKKCCGGSVTSLGVGPSVVQNYGLTSGSKGKTGVYITNGVGLATPNDLAQSYYHYDHVIFVWPQYIGNQYMSDENIVKHTVHGEWDWNRDQSWNIGGATAAKWFSSNPKVDLVAGTSAEDIAQRICSGTYVTSSGNPSSPQSGTSNNSSSSSSGGDSSSGSNDSSSNISPLLQGEMTFEELVGEICNGIDLLFLCKRSTVVVTDFSTIFAEALYLRKNHYSAVSDEDIRLWQLEEDSYELNINQFGFYNTVYVVYKNGVVKESFNDLVRVYGEMAITYKDKKINKTTAQMKAKSYLAAHLRDFELQVNATILSEPNIDIGDIVTLNNPKNKNKNPISSEYLFVKGINTNWEGEGPITTDLEMQFSPKSPDKREVPTTGTYNCAKRKNDNDNKNSSEQGSTSSGTFNSCGVSSDGTLLCAIGKPSATGEASKYGYKFYRSVFKRKCPFCGSDELYWGYMWSGNFPCTRKHNNGEDGKYEGHIYCDGCDADFSCIDGADHTSPPRAYLKRADSGPIKSSEEEAIQLKKGRFSI